jgi:hypothetical protein
MGGEEEGMNPPLGADEMNPRAQVMCECMHVKSEPVILV